MTAVSREPWSTATEIADWLGVHAETIRLWARTGVIPGHQPGGRVWLFRASEIEAAIARSSVAPIADAAPEPPRRRSSAVVTGAPITSLRDRLRQGQLGSTSPLDPATLTYRREVGR